MKTYNVELKRTSYITVTVEAENHEAAEEIAWLELVEHEHKDGYADWEFESIEEVQHENT
jgi:hypothetical protein